MYLLTFNLKNVIEKLDGSLKPDTSVDMCRKV